MLLRRAVFLSGWWEAGDAERGLICLPLIPAEAGIQFLEQSLGPRLRAACAGTSGIP